MCGMHVGESEKRKRNCAKLLPGVSYASLFGKKPTHTKTPDFGKAVAKDVNDCRVEPVIYP